MKTALGSILGNLRLAKANRGRNMVLLYHHVGLKRHNDPNVHSVSFSRFCKQISGLQAYGRFVDEDLFFDDTVSEKPKILLTFDDGFKETLALVEPFLQRKGIPSIYFVNQALATGRPFWRDILRSIITADKAQPFLQLYGYNIRPEQFYLWSKSNECNSHKLSEELLEYASSQSISFQESQYATLAELVKIPASGLLKLGNHSSHHYCLASVPAAVQQEEIMQTHDWLAGNFRQEQISRLFSVPFGGPESYTRQSVEIVKEAGYKGLLLAGTKDYYRRYAELSSDSFGLRSYKRFLPKENYRVL
ncbi:MAG: hypothetical protein EOP49_04890 [Sphingobacteriales bacterium]|nr:MAG: hypothetical protein EOP49_04890 [Sphingobacteriales bacterium]